MSIHLNKVLISDNVDKKCEELLRQHNIEVVSKFNLSPAELIKELEVRNFMNFFFVNLNKRLRIMIFIFFLEL